MKKALLIILALAVSMLFAVSAFADLFTVSYTTYDTTYEDILNMYIRVLNAGGDDGHRHDLFNDLIWNDFHHDYEDSVSHRIQEAKQRVGYCVYDLNGDGIDELIIGENYAYVNEVYTVDGGKVRELIRAGMKYDCALLENGYFYRHTKDGAARESSVIWKMDGTSAVRFCEGYRKDDEYGSDLNLGNFHDNQWFVITDENDSQLSDEKRVHIDEYLDWLKAWDQKLLPLDFISLAFYEQGITSDNVGIVSVKGKTNGKDTVRIRSEASKSSDVIKNARTGTYVNILGKEDAFYRISFGDLEGYIHEDFLTVLEDSESMPMLSFYPYGSEDYIRTRYLESRNSEAEIQTNPQEALPPAKEIAPENPEKADDEYYYESVLDHYENIEVQSSRQVYDHDEYTIVDNGDGTFKEVSHPVYRTEYYTETVQSPVYRQVLKKKGE